MTEKNTTFCSKPEEGELELINAYTRRVYSEDEVYVFSLTLCDNDVDRDFERFTVESLFELEKLFVGKTGIVDHISSSKNQTARIFKCEVKAVAGRKTLTGDDYFKLTARAYIPITDGNRETIEAIDSGIKKEISVGCAVKESVCSICGNKIGSLGCSHTKGQSYGGKLCFAELMSPYDAYEWSFVAVPAQREAGVTKGFKRDLRRRENNMEGIMKMLENKSELVLTKSECEKLLGFVKSLEKEAKEGKEYRQSLEREFTRLMAICEPEICEGTVKGAMSGLDTAQLKEFIAAMRKKAEGVLPLKPQLAAGKKERSKASYNKEFTI